jgi:hypothetical protein
MIEVPARYHPEKKNQCPTQSGFSTPKPFLAPLTNIKSGCVEVTVTRLSKICKKQHQQQEKGLQAVVHTTTKDTGEAPVWTAAECGDQRECDQPGRRQNVVPNAWQGTSRDGGSTCSLLEGI